MNAEPSMLDADVGIDEFLGAAGSGALGLFTPEDADALARKLASDPDAVALAVGVPPEVAALTPEAVYDAAYGYMADEAARRVGEQFGAEDHREAAERAQANMDDMFDAARYDVAKAGRALYDESAGDTYLMDTARAAYYRS